MGADEASRMVERKKAGAFGSLFGPGGAEVHVRSVKEYYECLVRASGRYVADYYRPARHTVAVDPRVRELVVGGERFPVRPKSRLARVFAKGGKNKVDLAVEEHVVVEEEAEIVVDHDGREAKFPYKTGRDSTESHPERALGSGPEVRGPGATREEVSGMLESRLRGDMGGGVRDLDEEFELLRLEEVYVPVYEARLVGPGRRAAVLRIDAARRRAF